MTGCGEITPTITAFRVIFLQSYLKVFLVVRWKAAAVVGAIAFVVVAGRAAAVIITELKVHLHMLMFGIVLSGVLRSEACSACGLLMSYLGTHMQALESLFFQMT